MSCNSVYCSTRNLRSSESAPGWSRTTPRFPGAPALLLRWVPAPWTETWSFSFNSEHNQGARSSASSSLLLLHRSLPPPIRVSGEWVTQGGRSHTSWPASTSPLLLPLAEAVELPGELARAPRNPCGLQQVRLVDSRPRVSCSRAWHWCACPRAGRQGSGGKKRRRAESLVLSPVAGWRSRTVSGVLAR